MYEIAEKKKIQEDRIHKLKYWMELINSKNIQLEYYEKYFKTVQIGETHLTSQK